MKKLTIYLLLISTAIMSMGAGCGKDDEDIQKDQFTSLVGNWIIRGGEGIAIKEDGSQKILGKVIDSTLSMELFDDGTLVGKDLVGDLKDEPGTWKLEVFKTDGRDIEEGTLSITTAYSKENAGSTFIDADGSIKYEIATIYTSVASSKPRMYLTTKKFKIDPYKEVWNTYLYEKQ